MPPALGCFPLRIFIVPIAEIVTPPIYECSIDKLNRGYYLTINIKKGELVEFKW